MASLRTVVCRRGLKRRLSNVLYSTRHESSAAPADLSVEHEVDLDAEIPLVPKQRDPHAVLKALSSTLTPLPHPLLMGGRSLADPMAPRTRALQLEYQRAQEAGRKSAQYVTKRWPLMFPDVKIEPDLHPSHSWPQGINEETLKSLIERKQTGRAMKLYQKLKDKGDPVSLETQNGLLELLAYYGVGNPGRGVRSEGVSGEGVGEGGMEELGKELGRNANEEAAAYLAEETNQETEETRSLKDRAHLMQFHRSPTQAWSLDNDAEKMFAEMPERNGGTYDALILGLVKYMNFDRAWEIFDDMKQNGRHQASVATYNALLYVIGNSPLPDDPWTKAMSLVQQMSEETVVKPDITTMNLLLEISAQIETSSSANISLKIFREILHLGLEPNLTTFLALLRAHIKSRDGSVLYDITDYLENNQHILEIKDTQDIYFFTVAMTTARNMLDHELAARLRRLCDRDNWTLCQNLTLFVSYYLTTITGRVPIETLRSEYNSFVPGTVLPMEWVYGVMFRACEEQENLKFGLELWNHVMKYHVNITSVDTISRFCGAMSKKIFDSEVDAVLKALMQAWEKCQQLNIPPPSVLIAQLIRLHCLNMDLDNAWKYFSFFEEYDRHPTFQALVSLLKGYSSAQDAEKTVQILHIILKHNMVIPTTFVRDVCWTAGVSESVRNKLASQFSRNVGETKSSSDISRDTDIQ